MLRDADLRAQIGAVEAASLVITGTHDPATPPSDGRALHAALRKSRYVELDSSHLSAWECADEFAGAVVQHLAAREESRWMNENGTRRACTCGGACWEMRMWIALRQRRAIWMRSSRI